MHRFIVLSAVLAGLALPAGAQPIEPDRIVPARQVVSDDKSRIAAVPEGRDVLLPKPVTAQFDAVPGAGSAETRPVVRLLEMPWQSGVFQ